MNDTTTFWWADGCGRLCEVDVPAHAAERIASGRPAAWRSSSEPSREDGARAIARLTARVDQIDARRAQLVNEWPALKAK